MLSYTISGSLDKPPLLFLHGFLGAKEDWEETIHHLKETFCCYAVDLPGHGTSPYEPHLLESLFSTYLSLKLPPCPLVGYSMGGRLALFLKKLFPTCFTQLILLGTHPGLQDELSKKQRLLQDLNWVEMIETQDFDTFLNAWYGQALFQSLRNNEALFQRILLRRSKQNRNALADILRNFSLGLQPTLTEFSADTLFVHGADDLKFKELYQNLPAHVKVASVIHAGHTIPLENPQGCADHIQQFLEVNSTLYNF